MINKAIMRPHILAFSNCIFSLCYHLSKTSSVWVLIISLNISFIILSYFFPLFLPKATLEKIIIIETSINYTFWLLLPPSWGDYDKQSYLSHQQNTKRGQKKTRKFATVVEKKKLEIVASGKKYNSFLPTSKDISPTPPHHCQRWNVCWLPVAKGEKPQTQC